MLGYLSIYGLDSVFVQHVLNMENYLLFHYFSG